MSNKYLRISHACYDWVQIDTNQEDPLYIEDDSKHVYNGVKLKIVSVQKADARGFGSVRSEERESMTLNKERAGDQLCLSISMQMFPRSEMFIWYILTMHIRPGRPNNLEPTHRVENVTFGAENL